MLRAGHLALALVAACAAPALPRERAGTGVAEVHPPGLEVLAATTAASRPAWEVDNPVVDLPDLPDGLEARYEDLPAPPDPAAARLGRWLFFDPRLSVDGEASCATCHEPRRAFGGVRPAAVAGRRPARRAPRLVNLAWIPRPHLGWDGRAGSLEEVVRGALVLGFDTEDAHAGRFERSPRLAPYAPYFEEAFGDAAVTDAAIARALADYLRTRASGGSAVDRWVLGDDAALSPAALRGRELFAGRGRCQGCHGGPMYADGRFHNLGVGWDPRRRRFADDGRAAVSGRDEDRGAFRTPSLREVAVAGPYMHDGSLPGLREVVAFHDRGGVQNPLRSPALRATGLDAREQGDVVAFLEALRGEGWRDDGPATFPR